MFGWEEKESDRSGLSGPRDNAKTWAYLLWRPGLSHWGGEMSPHSGGDCPRREDGLLK